MNALASVIQHGVREELISVVRGEKAGKTRRIKPHTAREVRRLLEMSAIKEMIWILSGNYDVDFVVTRERLT